MSREERAQAYAEEVVRNALWSDIEYQSDETLAISDVAKAYLQGAEDADKFPAWRMCEDELPNSGVRVLVMTKNSEYPYFGEYYPYFKEYGEGSYGYWEVEDADVIRRSDDMEDRIDVVAWLPIPQFNQKAEEE